MLAPQFKRLTLINRINPSPRRPPPSSAAAMAAKPLLHCSPARRSALLLLTRCIASALPPDVDLEVDLSHPVFSIWGSNTGVGKTLVSTGIASSVLSTSSSFSYIKPVQTGFPLDSDSRFVYRKVSEVFARRHPELPLMASNRVLKASRPASEGMIGPPNVEDGSGAVTEGFRELCWYEERRVVGAGVEFDAPGLSCKTMFAWKEAISPHLAAEREEAMVDDSSLRGLLQECLIASWRSKDAWTLIETAGGVASPGPSGSLQCDLYRPFRFPVVLVGDGRLGGISGTISAYETLRLRGYDIVAIVLEDKGLSNEDSLLRYLRNRIHVLVLPLVPQDPEDNLLDWYEEACSIFNYLQEVMHDAYLARIKKLQKMSEKAKSLIWWPFTQHNLVPKESVTVIDSRCGENFAVYEDREAVVQKFDACASWWTQGPDATMQIELAQDMGYACARFGHVMFPENVYEPVLSCSELLLEGVGRGWASRVFFSDNGSTAIEIALKMAFRKFSFDHGVLINLSKQRLDEKCPEYKVLALNGSYHGDTLGAMEAQAPSSYTGFLQQPWYSGRGFFLKPPTAFLANGIWLLTLPDVIKIEHLETKDMVFQSNKEFFYEKRNSSDLARHYSSYISNRLKLLAEAEGFSQIAALILEPVIHGAGGMLLVDPLFQRILVKQCQSRKIPVIFDEVFTGFWRLGVESAAELLGCTPDIACYSKLLTGGVVPLAATLATDAVFSTFKADSKLMALLHGHSYSGHAMGCTAAVKAIQWFKDPSTNCNILPEGLYLRELWDTELVREISFHSAVERITVLGTLCAIELKVVEQNTGYASLYASSLVQKLRGDGVYVRPLGNVVYLMCGPCTSPHICNHALQKVYNRIRKECS